MKPHISVVLAIAALSAATQASGHDKDYHDNGRYGYDSRYDVRYDERYDDRYPASDGYYQQYPQARYAQAKVVRVDRIDGYDTDFGRNCGAYDVRGNRSGIHEGAVLGAVIGGFVGNQAASDQNRTAATLAGAAIGGLIGQSVDRDDRGGYDRQYVQCRADWSRYRERDVDYRVTYRYQGRYYTTIMPYHPGKKVLIRVDARPQSVARVAYRY